MAIYASNGSSSDVQAKINAASNGDTVTIPAGGTFYWTTQVTIDSKGIKLCSTNPAQRPTIQLAMTTSYYGILAIASPSNFVTIQDLIFTNVSIGAQTGPINYTVHILGSGVCFRLSNCKWTNNLTSKIVTQIGNLNYTEAVGPYGLVDNCTWDLGPSFAVCMYVMCNGAFTHWGWTQPMTWGTVNTVCIEDCTYIGQNVTNNFGYRCGEVVDSYGGGRVLFRHNYCLNYELSTHGATSGANDSTLQFELLHNQIVNDDPSAGAPGGRAFWYRGGTAVVTDNTVTQSRTGSYTRCFVFSEECASSAWQSESCPRLITYPSDYPAFQQIGRGVVGSSEGSVPVYCWGNHIPSGSSELGLGLDSDAQFIGLGRDVINGPRPGYTELAYPHPLSSGVPAPETPDPNIDTHPSGASKWPTESVTFSVTASGTAPLSYQWKRATDNIPGATSSSYTRSNLTSSDAADYTVVVTNSLGSITSSPATLTMLSPLGLTFASSSGRITAPFASDAEVWSSVGDGVNPDYAIAPLSGSQSLQINNSAQYTRVYAPFSPLSDVWGYCEFKILALPVTADSITGFLLDTGTISSFMQIGPTGSVKLGNNSFTSAASALTLSVGTKYYLWMHCVSGVMDTLYINTTSSRPTSDSSGSAFIQLADANGGTYKNVYLYHQFAANVIYDNILVRSTPIGSAPAGDSSYLINQDFEGAGYHTQSVTISQAYPTVNPTLGGSANYFFQVEVAGDYTISALVDCSTSGSNSFFVGMDAEPVASDVWDVPVTIGLESRDVIITPFTVAKVYTLSTGVHQFIIRGREAGAHLGAITISQVGSPTPQVASVTFSPNGGTVAANSMVALSCATVGASIFYHVDAGPDIPYTVPFSIGTLDHLVTAYATLNGYLDSSYSYAVFIVPPPPTSTPSLLLRKY